MRDGTHAANAPLRARLAAPSPLLARFDDAPKVPRPYMTTTCTASRWPYSMPWPCIRAWERGRDALAVYSRVGARPLALFDALAVYSSVGAWPLALFDTLASLGNLSKFVPGRRAPPPGKSSGEAAQRPPVYFLGGVDLW